MLIFFIDYVLGLATAAFFVGWVFVVETNGWDHRPTKDEIVKALWRCRGNSARRRL